MITRLRERVTIERVTVADDGYGGQAETWTVVETVPAEVRPVKGRESVDGERLVTAQTYLVTIWYRAISTRDRLDWRGTKMNIRSAENRDMRRIMTVMECEVGFGT